MSTVLTQEEIPEEGWIIIKKQDQWVAIANSLILTLSKSYKDMGTLSKIYHTKLNKIW